MGWVFFFFLLVVYTIKASCHNIQRLLSLQSCEYESYSDSFRGH